MPFASKNMYAENITPTSACNNRCRNEARRAKEPAVIPTTKMSAGSFRLIKLKIALVMVFAIYIGFIQLGQKLLQAAQPLDFTFCCFYTYDSVV